jgi:predicted ribosome quality control (RQC) complex YloA/Tae2 family protein
MLSYCELKRATGILGGMLAGKRLQRVCYPEAHKLVLVFQDSEEKICLLLCCSPEFARISILKETPGPSAAESSFAEYLRAHITRGSLTEIRLSPGDRRAGILIKTAEGIFELLHSILGPRSNIYLLGSDKRLIHSFRPLDETRRDLQLGSIWTDPDKPLRSEGADRWATVPDVDYLETVEQAYYELEANKEAADTARKIENALTKEGTFLKRKIANLEEDLAEARKAEGIRKRGELLKSVLHAVEPGSDAVVARDYETGEVIEIALDPRLSPAQNLEAYFARYQKEVRGLAVIEKQLLAAHAVRGEIDGLLRRLQEIMESDKPDLGLLQELAQNRFTHKLLTRHYPARKTPQAAEGTQKKSDVPTRLLPKRYMTEEGLEIWVGRSDEGNDYLSTRLARGNDLFFHLDGYPGSHVVLRTEGKPEAPQNSILDACELAIHFSKMKNASRADVHVAHIKDVKKPRGAKPGLVYVLRGKTIHLRRNPKRLRDILSSRIED